MIEKTPISEAVRQVCAAHFDGSAMGCSRCMIRGECHSSPTANLTFEGMEAWRQRLNTAAGAQATPNAE